MQILEKGNNTFRNSIRSWCTLVLGSYISLCSLCLGKSDRDEDYRWPLFLPITVIVNESNNELTTSPSFHLCYQRDSQRCKILRRHFKSPILIAVICNLCVGAVVSARAVTLLPGATFSCDCSSEGSRKHHSHLCCFY